MSPIDGFLLTRHWRDTTDGLQLTFWASTPRGPLRLRLTGQEAVCFIGRNEPFAGSGGVRRSQVDLRKLSSASVDALYFRRQRDLASLNRQPHWQRTLCESDIKPTDRYLMERFVLASFSATGELIEGPGYLKMEQPRLKPARYHPAFKVASIDIETQGLSGPLYSIAAVCAEQAGVFMIGDRADVYTQRYRLMFFPDERRLLQAFFDWLAQRDPDLLIGWNVIDFDLDYLARKCKALNLPLQLGRGGEPATVLQPRTDAQPRVARLPGRVVLDGIDLLRAGFWSFERFSLEHVARELLGRGKLVGDRADKVEVIDKLFRDDKLTLAEYNWLDCQRVIEIFDKADLIDFAIQRASITGLGIDRLGGSVAALDNLYLPQLHRQGYVAPNVGVSEPDGPGSPGGYVMDSQPGLFDNVLVLDFKSLYPSIIRTFLIDPLGLATAADNPVPGFQGAAFSRQRHILPGLIADLMGRRETAKRQANAPLSQAIKIIMNSFYGVLATSRCRFHDHRLASSITRRGHEIITRSRDFIVDDKGYSVIYGDTDSIFVLLGADVSEAGARAIGDQLAGSLNHWWRDILRAEHGLESALEVEFETHFLRFLMPTVRGNETGSKKRYAGTVRDCNGNIDLVFKGLEAVRTDWTTLAREFQRELFRRVFLDQPFEAFVRQTVDDLQAGKKDRALVYRKALRRPLAEYKVNVPPHVQAARKQSVTGKSIAYLITVNGPEPVDNTRSPPDYQHYIKRQLAPAADGILHFLGTSFETITDSQIPLL